MIFVFLRIPRLLRATSLILKKYLLPSIKNTYKHQYPTLKMPHILSIVKVLIVEDNPKMRRMLTEFVRSKFTEIYECNDGEQAFLIYAERHPDWVLMDWQMPNKDGIAATREIIDKFPAAKICLVTSYDDAFLKSEALEAGAKGFVLKRNLAELDMILVSELEH